MIDTFLQNHGILYERFDHPPVFTCEDAKQFCPPMPGFSTKNIFLIDKKSGRYFLVVVGHEKRVDLKKLKGLLSVANLSFGSPECLKRLLGVDPGSVTLLGLIHDVDKTLNVIVDEQIWTGPLQCHPLVNTATLVLPHAEVLKFLAATGHSCQVLDIPECSLD